MGWSEILLIAIVVLVVFQPKDLPGLFVSAGRMVARLRALSDQFQREMEALSRESGIDDMRRDIRGFGKDMNDLLDFDDLDVNEKDGDVFVEDLLVGKESKDSVSSLSGSVSIEKTIPVAPMTSDAPVVLSSDEKAQ